MAKTRGLKSNLNIVLKRGIDKLNDGTTVIKIGFRARILNIKQLNMGMNVSGELMKPYSQEYIESKLFERLKISQTVNLQLTNRMINNLHVVGKSALHASVQFTRELERKKAVGNTRHRGRFVGITIANQVTLRREARGLILESLNGT